MKKILNILSLILLFTVSTTTAHSEDLRNMDEKRRNKILIKEAKRAILKHAPGFYRDFTPKIILSSESAAKSKINYYHHLKAKYKDGRDLSHLDYITEIMKGRKWYTVRYPYDPRIDGFNGYYSAEVYIWADTHVAFQLCTGYGYVLFDIDKPVKKGEKMPFAVFKKSPPYNPIVDEKTGKRLHDSFKM